MRSWQAEIVCVVDKHFLTNTDHESFPYQNHYGTPLDPGHYLALRMAGMSRQYKHGIVFFGPFVSETQAEILLQSSRYLDLLTAQRAEKMPASRAPLRKVDGDMNLPVLLRWRDPNHYLVLEKRAPYKNQRPIGG
jgi:hypothetical protein